MVKQKQTLYRRAKARKRSARGKSLRESIPKRVIGKGNRKMREDLKKEEAVRKAAAARKKHLLTWYKGFDGDTEISENHRFVVQQTIFQ